MTRRTELFLLALLVAITAVVFGPVARHAFVNYDDGLFVYANPHVRGGLSWDGLVYAFTNWEHRIWAPLTWLSHMADVQCFGIEGQVLGWPASGWHHLTNLALHLACVLLLYAFLRSATGARWRSLLVAALFALHPLHVESVAWISERKTLLSTAFGLLCLLSYLRYARQPGAGRYLATLAWLALGLMSKPMLVTWPFVMLLLDWWPLGRLAPRARWGRLLLEKLPFFALVAASSLVTYLAQGPAMELMRVVSFGMRLQNAVVAGFSYVLKTIWPTGLAVLYPYRAATPALLLATAGVSLLLITWLALRVARRRPYAIWGWFWFLGTLVPVSGLVQVGNHSMADRYTYVPLVGLFVLAVWAGAELAARLPASKTWAAAAAVLVLLAACTSASARQLRHWSDTESLFRHTCEVTRDNGEARRALGDALALQGRQAEAIAEYHEALRILPAYVDAHMGLGDTLAEAGRADEALREWREALRIHPDLALAHSRIGAALIADGQAEQAVHAFREAVRLEPDEAATHNNLASALAQAGQLEPAIAEYRQALRLQPELVPARVFLGRALAQGGRLDEAAHEFREAVRLEPTNIEALLELAEACAGTGHLDEALAAAQQAQRQAAATGAHALEATIDQRLAQYRRQAPAR